MLRRLMDQQTLINLVLGALAGLGGLLLSVIGFEAKRQARHIEELQREKANKDSTDVRFDRLALAMEKHAEADLRMHSALIEKDSLMVERQGQTNVALAEIKGEITALKDQLSRLDRNGLAGPSA